MAVREYQINGQNKELESDLLALWAKFCFKSPPLEELDKKTVSQKFSAAHKYYNDNFVGNLCFYERDRGFAVFGEGQKWLDYPIQEFAGKKVAVLIMGASLNKDLSDARFSLILLQESFRRLKEEKNYDVVVWNINRKTKKKGFERLMKILGGKKLEDCWFV